MTSLTSDLVKTQAFVDGQWIPAADGLTFAVDDPATLQPIAHVADLNAADAERAVIAADKAWRSWRQVSTGKRAELLLEWRRLILAHADEIVQIICAEQGKPTADARYEIGHAASFIEWYAEEGKRAYGDIIPSPNPNEQLLVTRESIGVCAAITPWNLPFAMVARKVAPALAAGCTMIIKPAEQTPLSALAMAALAERAGIPAGVLQVVPSCEHLREVGQVLTTHPLVRKVTFTGSTEVGKILMRQAASTVKKVSLELGGNSPFIVFDDADLEQAVAGAMAAKFRNSGQTCLCANRIFVQAGIYDRFAEKLTAAVRTLKVGPSSPDVQIGPLIDEPTVLKVLEHIADAAGKGGTVAVGGKRIRGDARFVEPTVITHAQTSMRLFREETFGPVAPLFKFDTEADVISMANDCDYGLAAYLYSNDLSRVWRMTGALEFGAIGVNTGAISNAVAPFGGMKESGIGREGSKYGLEEYMEMKYVCMAIKPSA